MPIKVLTVKVLDAETGRPVRAEIRFFFPVAGDYKRRIRHTDEHGRSTVRIPGEKEKITVKVIVRVPTYREFGLGADESSFEVKAGEPREVEIALRRAPSVRGRLVNEEGEPISGASIDLVLSGPDWGSAPHAVALSIVGGNTLREPPPMKTNKDGRFQVLHLHPDQAEEWHARYLLTFHHPRYMMTRVQAVEKLPARDGWIDLKVVMPYGVKASGVVRLPSGKCLPGGEISFMEEDARVERAAKINSRGRFSAPGLMPGRYVMKIKGDACAPFSQDDFDVPADGLRGLAFVVEPSATFRGRFVGERGSTVADQEFWVIDSEARTQQKLVSNTRGRFVVRGLNPSRKFHLEVPRKFEQDYQPSDSPVTIVLGESQTITGTVKVKDTGRAPDAPFHISYHGPGYSTGQDFEAGRDQYELKRVPPGTYELAVYGERWMAETYRVKVPIGGRKRGLPIRLKKGATLSGRIEDAASGRPISGAAVEVRAAVKGILGFYDKKKTETDTEGRFRVRGLGNRPYRVHISHPRYASEVIEGFEIAQGQKAGRLGVGLRRGGKIRGVVIGEDGRPAAELLVKAKFADDRWYPYPLPECLTDRDGKFELKHVPPGKSTVSAENAQKVVEVTDRRTRTVKLTLGRTGSS